MNFRAIFSISGLRIVLYVGKLYNFACVAIALNYANLSIFSQNFGFYHFFVSELFTLSDRWQGYQKGDNQE
jgi:uncharacterized membrane protein